MGGLLKKQVNGVKMLPTIIVVITLLVIALFILVLIKVKIPPTTILFMASDPSNEARLRLGYEHHEIQKSLQPAIEQGRFKLDTRLAVQPKDIRQALAQAKPQIVHFSGHGMGSGGLIFEDERGQSQPVSTQALEEQFRLVSKSVKCVVLNACYAEVQATAIVSHIKYVVGMTEAIGDKAAIAFARGFYGALVSGESVDRAFEFGRSEIITEGIPQELLPVLRRKPGSDPNLLWQAIKDLSEALRKEITRYWGRPLYRWLALLVLSLLAIVTTSLSLNSQHRIEGTLNTKCLQYAKNTPLRLAINEEIGITGSTLTEEARKLYRQTPWTVQAIMQDATFAKDVTPFVLSVEQIKECNEVITHELNLTYRHDSAGSEYTAMVKRVESDSRVPKDTREPSNPRPSSGSRGVNCAAERGKLEQVTIQILNGLRVSGGRITGPSLPPSDSCPAYDANDDGIKAYEANKDDVAIINFTLAISLDNKLGAAYNNRAAAYERKEDWAAAIADYNQAIALNGNYPWFIYNRGLTRFKQEKSVRLRNAPRTSPIGLTSPIGTKEDFGQFITEFEKLQDENTLDKVFQVSVLTQLSVFYRERGDYARAASLLEDLLAAKRLEEIVTDDERKKSSSLVELVLAKIMVYEGKPKEALEHLNKTVNLGYNKEEVYYYLAVAQYMHNQNKNVTCNYLNLHRSISSNLLLSLPLIGLLQLEAQRRQDEAQRLYTRAGC